MVYFFFKTQKQIKNNKTTSSDRNMTIFVILYYLYISSMFHQKFSELLQIMKEKIDKDYVE